MNTESGMYEIERAKVKYGIAQCPYGVCGGKETSSRNHTEIIDGKEIQGFICVRCRKFFLPH